MADARSRQLNSADADHTATALSPSGQTQLRAEVERVSYRNDENGWTVLRAINQLDSTVFTATGHFAAIHSGGQFEFFGTWGKHATYGPQFKVERCVPIRPSSAPAIENYLASGLIKGIGPKTANRIVEHFGDDTLDILDATPHRLAEVTGLGKKKAADILVSWKEQRSVANVMMFLNTHGVSPLYASKIFREYGPEAIKIVSQDPYRLAIDIHGIGFLSADKIARSMGIAADSAERMRAAILFQLQQAEERGHCYATTPQLIRMLQGCLSLPEDRILPRLADCLAQLSEVGAIVSERLTLEDPDGGITQTSAHFRQDLLIAEWNVAKAAGALLTHPLDIDTERVDEWLKKYSEVSGTALSEEQIEAVRKSVSHRMFVLTGGPGVGKTTTANTIIRLLKAMGRTVALGAPTGRAAQRLTEVAAAPARTIHRMLEWLPAMHAFARDETNPLTVQAVIIDEASMLDIRLADALIRAIPKTAQLILIGDVDQLPSVGPGNVLRDMIDSGVVPYTRLSRIFRQAASSNIIRAAHTINEGEMPEFPPDGQTDCHFIEADTGDEIKAIIRDLMSKELPKLGYDPLGDMQLLTPMNRGELGTQTLNEELQRLLNPPRPGQHEWKRGSNTLRAGDKVIQSVNNYDLGVFNGDIGFVQQTNVDGGRVTVSFGEDRIVHYEDDDAMDLRLAYAITIHKSQGSEFPVVIIPATMQHYVMLQRNLMYTALTRAKKLAYFVGAKKALNFAVQNSTSQKRQTSLIAKLKHDE